MNDPVSKLSFHKRALSLITPSYPCVCAVARWRIFQTPRYSYAHEQLQAVTLFIKHNSSTLYWQLEVKMAFIQHKARAHSMPIKSAEMIPNTLRQRKQCGLMRAADELSVWGVKVKCGHTLPSKTISYPSRSLILL